MSINGKSGALRMNYRTGTKVPLVSDFMTPSPHTIGRDQTLAAAHELMRRYRVRHLPVLEGGKLLGLVSQRDLFLVETLDDAAPSQVKVDEAMSQDVFRVSPGTPIVRAANEMIKHKYGCAVVCDGSTVVGIFTTIDALRALIALTSS